jgi:hypothetical protein
VRIRLDRMAQKKFDEDKTERQRQHRPSA